MSFDAELQHAIKGTYQVAKRRWKTFVAFFSGVLSLTVIGLIICPRTYVSESSLFVRVGRESVSLDPTATTAKTIEKNESREHEINSIKDILGSRSLFADVVESLGAEAVLEPSEGDETTESRAPGFSIGSQLGSMAAAIGLSDPVSQEEKAIRSLEESFTVSSEDHSNVILIQMEGKSPKHAQSLMRAYLAAYRDLHRRVHRTAGSEAFFDEQGTLIKEQLDATVRRLKEVKNESGIVSIDAQQSILQEKARHIATAVLDQEAALIATQASIEAIRSRLAGQPQRIETEVTSGRANGAYDAIAAQLYNLRVRERELASKYTASHPYLSAVRKQIEDAEKIAADHPQERTETSSNVNPTYQHLELELLVEQAAEASIAHRLDTLHEQLAENKAESRRLNELQVTIEELEREKAILTASYRKYAEHHEEARIDLALGDEGISNVNMIDNATYIERPVKPRKLIVLCLAFVFAFCGGIAAVYLRECFATPAIESGVTVEEAPANESAQSNASGRVAVSGGAMR